MEEEMREVQAMDCACGEHLEAADDEELFRVVRLHVDQHHPDLQLTDEHVRVLIEANAYTEDE
jgi:hypothetical protein